MTYDRIKMIKGIQKDDIYISTNSCFRDTVLQQIDIQDSHCICEPAKRDNAAAILQRADQRRSGTGIFTGLIKRRGG